MCDNICRCKNYIALDCIDKLCNKCCKNKLCSRHNPINKYTKKTKTKQKICTCGKIINDNCQY